MCVSTDATDQTDETDETDETDQTVEADEADETDARDDDCGLVACVLSMRTPSYEERSAMPVVVAAPRLPRGR
jgi:hypothetical protein